jgi:hypothetical protein
MRKIEVNGVEYSWRVGSVHVLIENRTLGQKWIPTKVEATMNYHNWSDFEKCNASITPAMIKRYIETQLAA